MAVIAVGGQAKHVGKTTLVCNIIRSFPQWRWTAVKFTHHLYSPATGKTLSAGSGWQIFEESSSRGESDTARFLQAGSVLSILVYSEHAALAEACSFLLPHLEQSQNAIVESSSAGRLLDPDLSLLIIDPGRSDFKEAAREHLAHIDALIVREGSAQELYSCRLEGRNTPIFASKLSGLDPGLSNLLKRVVIGTGA